MTRQSARTEEASIEAELDRLTYSAYLLTLDPDLALSVVLTALDWSLEKPVENSDLQRRTVELSLRQLQQRSGVDGDSECPSYEAVLYDDSGVANSKRLSGSEEDRSSNPILSLDAGSRIAFVLHHVLGYDIEKSALLADLDEKGFRAQLRRAYVQLASCQLWRFDAHPSEVLGQSALV
jgi:DNA-directed RNA polymerase specialized sigma24 family protein